MKQYKFSELTYTPTDYKSVAQEIAQLTKCVEEATNFKQIEEILNQYDVISSKLSYQGAYTFIRTSLDCTDEYYANAAQTEAIGMEMLDISSFNKALCESKFVADIDRLYGCEYLRKLRNETKTKSNAADLRAREQELIGRYQQKKASTRIDYDGKNLSEGEILKFFPAPDRNVRIESRKACFKAFLAEKDDFFSILRELVHVRNDIAKENGFDSYLEYADLIHGRNDYGEMELTEFCNQVKKYLVPIIEKIREDQKKELGIKDLKAYDLSLLFRSGNAVPIGDAKVLTQASQRMYDKLSEECGIFFKSMVDSESLNVESATNKIAGMGFCTDLGKEYLPYVFGNCHGTDTDVAVFTHEIGHAFQGYLSANSNMPYIIQNPPTDIAEIPSKTMELFAYPYAKEFFGKDADKFVEGHFKKAILEIAAYCEIFEYETYLYNNPDASVEQWIKVAAEVEKKYEPNIDYSELQGDINQGVSLIRNMALYMFPRYVISYALSEMCAMDLFSMVDKNKERVWNDYMTICEAGGSMAYPTLLEQINMSPAYEDGVVKRIASFMKGRLK